jgi:membrane protease YdiL (CAAX protease family)
MTGRTGSARAHAREAWTLLLVAVGVAMLVARLWLPALGSAGRTAGLVAILLAILAASLLVPVRPSAVHAAPWAVTALGVGAVGLAFALVRPVPASTALAAIPIVVLAAVAEEALFRRAMYGALERHGAALAIAATALAFALMHVPLYGLAAFPVDLGAGLLFSWQRWAAGSWTAPAATHAAANLLLAVAR